MPANLENSAVARGLEKVSFHSNPKECSNYCTTALISHASKEMLKILQARLQQYVTTNFQMFKLVLEKAEEPEIKLPTSAGSKKQESSRKTSISALLTMSKPLTVWIIINCGKVLRDGNTRPPDLPLEKPVCRSGSNSQNWTWKKRLVPNRKRSTSRLYIVTLLI